VDKTREGTHFRKEKKTMCRVMRGTIEKAPWLGGPLAKTENQASMGDKEGPKGVSLGKMEWKGNKECGRNPTRGEWGGFGKNDGGDS